MISKKFATHRGAGGFSIIGRGTFEVIRVIADNGANHHKGDIEVASGSPNVWLGEPALNRVHDRGDISSGCLNGVDFLTAFSQGMGSRRGGEKKMVEYQMWSRKYSVVGLACCFQQQIDKER